MRATGSLRRHERDAVVIRSPARSVPPRDFLVDGEDWETGGRRQVPPDPALESALEVISQISQTIFRARTRGRARSLRRVSELAGVSRDTVSRIESGATWPDLQVLLRVCAALDLELIVVPRHPLPAPRPEQSGNAGEA